MESTYYNDIFAKTWFKVIGIYLIVQAVLGIVGIEFAWYRTRRFRKQDRWRDENFPAFSRLDAQKWSRWKFYPGAILMMPTRAVLLILDAIFLVFIIS